MSLASYRTAPPRDIVPHSPGTKLDHSLHHWTYCNTVFGRVEGDLGWRSFFIGSLTRLLSFLLKSFLTNESRCKRTLTR